MASNHTRPRKKGGALKILLVLLVLVLAAAGGAFLLAKREIDGGTRQDAVTVEIAQGSGVSTIARQLKEAGVIRFPQLFRSGGRTHATRAGQQQRIVKDRPQFGEMHTDRRLGEIEPLCRARDVVLRQQRVERHQQVEIQLSEDIIHLNT